MKALWAILGAAILFAAPVWGQGVETETPGLYIIYDSSNSMWGELPDGARKYEAARAAITDFLGGDFAGQDLALRVYGANRPDDCSDSNLEVPFQTAADAIPLIEEAVGTSRPTGRTPIHLSFMQALEDFDGRPGRILLISDGIESCGADPCVLLQEWRDRDVNIDVHIVGLGLRAEERPALTCMANAAGTPFHDVQSASELADALGSALSEDAVGAGDQPEGGTPEDFAALAPPVLILELRNEEGASLRGEGIAYLVNEDGTQVEFSETLRVATHARNSIVPGTNLLRAGVMTRNGDLYLPEELVVDVVASGETRAELTVTEPPRVSVRLEQDGEVLAPTGQVEALQDGEVAFTFRTQDEVYLNPGTYEFRTSPNDFNQSLSVVQEVAATGTTEVVFQLASTVETTVRFFSRPWGERLMGAVRFSQGGEERAGVNATNAVTLAPGTYQYEVDYKFGPITGDVVIESDTPEYIDIEVPAARIVVRYETVDGAAEDDKRFFVAPENGGRRRAQQSGTEFFLTPGAYRLEGWGGSYDPIDLSVSEGEDLQLVFRTTE